MYIMQLSRNYELTTSYDTFTQEKEMEKSFALHLTAASLFVTATGLL